MKILHALAQYPDRTGSGIYCCSLINSLADLGLTDQALVFSHNPEQEIPQFAAEPYPVHFKTDKLPFPVVGMSDVMPYESTVYSQMSEEQIRSWKKAFREKLNEAVDEFNPDVIICHHLWMLASLCLELNLPTLCISHGTDIRQAEQHPEYFHTNVGDLRALDKVAALSEIQVKQLKNTYGLKDEQIFLGGGAYNHIIFKPAAKREEGEIVRLAYVGKIADAKGSFELIEAFRGIPEEEKVSLCMLGNIGDMAERFAKAKGDDERITLCMPQSQEIMAERLREKDIFVFPSYYEGLGLIAIEALATGLRLVVNDLPALRNFLGEEIWQDEHISVVEMPRLINVDEIHPDDREAYIKRLRAALLEQVQRFREGNYAPSALSSSLQEFTWHGLARRILAELEKIIRSK